MRPVTRSTATAAGWSRPAQLDFSNYRKLGEIQKVFGTATPTADACLVLWNDAIEGARALSTDEQAALVAIKDKVDSEYRKAAPYLLDDIGRYCAYCELPVHEPLQIEHVLPKSQYPTFALEWDNFLPACTGCNSRKREKPLRSLVATWLDTAPCTPPACRQEIRTHYRWPDSDPVVGYFSVGLFYEDPSGGGWRMCDEADAVDPNLRDVSSSIVDGKVCAYLPALGDVPVAALVYDATPGGDARTKETIALCKLDRLLQPKDASDMRTRYRTEAWLTAVRTLRPLGVPATLPETVRLLVLAKGFYWVWLTVAKLIDPGLERRVIDETKRSLPGTDEARLT
jgi:hypothetical protein